MPRRNAVSFNLCIDAYHEAVLCGFIPDTVWLAYRGRMNACYNKQWFLGALEPLDEMRTRENCYKPTFAYFHHPNIWSWDCEVVGTMNIDVESLMLTTLAKSLVALGYEAEMGKLTTLGKIFAM